MKKVAIITRTKDRSLFYERLLNSIYSQTLKDFIWVIVNDSGKKEPVIVLYEKAKSLGIDVKLIHNDINRGMEASSNIGIKSCNSKYIVIHDDDDTWEPDFLKETIRLIESDQCKEYGGIITQTIKIIEELKNDDTCNVIKKVKYNCNLTEVYLRELAKRNLFPPISFLYKREIYNKIKGYDETLPVLGDWDFNLKFLIESNIGVIQTPLANYHFRTKKKLIKKEYENTVVHKLYLHGKYDAVLRNRYLREDIKKGSMGLGFLTNIVKEDENPHKIINLFKKISGEL